MALENNDGLLIAETNESGEVACVWIWTSRGQIPRPVRPGSPVPLDRYSVSGAPRSAVNDWLTRPRPLN